MAGARDERQSGGMRPTMRPARRRAGDDELHDRGSDLAAAAASIPHADAMAWAPASRRGCPPSGRLVTGRAGDDNPRQLGRWENEGGALGPPPPFA